MRTGRQQRKKLQVGGTVNPRTGIYIVRPSDDELLRLLERGEYANVLCSRQMGKSSLLMRTKARLDERNYRTAVVDIAGYLGTSGTASEWYQGLLDEIAHKLGLAVNVSEWWGAKRAATPNQRMIQFFRDEVATKVDRRAVIFLDEIDSTQKLSYTDDFFVAIRAMYNERAAEALYERITFCLAGVATPNDLIKDRRTTPYNIGRTIELQDFDPERDDLSPLYGVVAGSTAKGAVLVRSVLRWTGGHPYLTVRLCDHLVAAGKTLRRQVDALIEKEFASLDHLHSDVHFQQIIRFLAERVNDKQAVLTLYRQILAGRELRDESAPEHIALRLAGIVKRDLDGRLVVRNPIYARVFTDEWTAKALKSLKSDTNPFLRMLDMLDADRELAAEEYERLREGLMLFFRTRGLRSYEELADETFERLMRRIERGEAIQDIARYSYGVARLVLKEALRREQALPTMNDLPLPPDPEAQIKERAHQELTFKCMERCMAQLPQAHQELLIEYYRVYDGESKHSGRAASRRALAKRLGVSEQALLLQLSRIRSRLRECVERCIRKEES